jgi:zeta-carotene desaturase
MARAVFNEDPDRVSARLFSEVVRRLFLEGADPSSLSHARSGLSDTYAEPAARYLERRGSALWRGCAVRRVDRRDGRFTLQLIQGAPLTTEGLCLAVPAGAARTILQGELASACPGLEGAAGFPSAPLVSVNLWFGGPEEVLREPFVGLVDGVFAWYFDRNALAEDSGGNRHVALVAPGARALLDLPAARIADIALSTLARYTQVLERRQLIDYRVIKEPHAAPSLTPEVEEHRPGQETREAGLALAGDWTATGLPATLESAASSGHQAARLLHASLVRRK